MMGTLVVKRLKHGTSKQTMKQRAKLVVLENVRLLIVIVVYLLAFGKRKYF